MNLKKLTFLILIFFIGFPLFSQTITKNEKPLEISKLKLGLETYASINYYESLDSYLLSFRDMRYNQIVEFESVYLGNKESVININEALLDLISDKDKDASITINLSDGKSIIFSKITAMGVVSVQGNVYNGNFLTGQLIYLNKKRINTLFPINKIK